MDVQDAEHIVQLRKKKGKWTVIKDLIKIWMERSPEEFKGFKVHLKDIKETRLDKKFGQTHSKKQERRLILVFPMALQSLIRTIYSSSELPFNRAFFHEFGKRFRIFQIPEKL